MTIIPREARVCFLLSWFPVCALAFCIASTVLLSSNALWPGEGMLGCSTHSRCQFSHIKCSELRKETFFFCPCYVICFFCVVLQRQRLIQARGGHEGGGPAGEEGLGVSGPWGRENGTVNEGDRQMLESERELSKEISGEARGAAVSKEEEEEEQDEGEDHNSPFNPFSLPGEQTISCCTYS